MNFVKVFRESLSYLRKIKTYIYLAAGLFLFGAIIGFFSSSQLGFLDELLKNLAKQAEGLNTREIIWFIFQNNLKSAFFTMILGVFLGIFPVINALTNGVLLGYVFSRVSAIDGWVSLWKIFPHGIFELPAVFIAMGLGMSMGFGFINNYFRRYKKDRVMKTLGIISLISAFIGLTLIISPLNAKAFDILYNILIVLFGIFLTAPFVLLFFLNDKKLGLIQRKSISEKFYSSLKVFFYAVLPLLVIAAIIEGLLIAYYAT